MNVPPVRMAMSSSIALRRSPKPGAFTARTLIVPRSLFTTSVASASPSTSSQMITKFFVTCSTFSSTGRMSCDGGDLLVGDQDVGVLEDGFHAVRVRHEVGRDVAAVELHAIDELGLELDAAGLFDGDDAVLADLLHHLGDQLADLRVVGGDGGDLRDLVLR